MKEDIPFLKKKPLNHGPYLGFNKLDSPNKLLGSEKHEMSLRVPRFIRDLRVVSISPNGDHYSLK